MPEVKKSKKKNVEELIKQTKTDIELSKLSYFSQLLFCRMIIEQDDERKLSGNLEDFIHIAFPISRNIADNEFEKALEELESAGLIIWKKGEVIQIIAKYRPKIGHRKCSSAFGDLMGSIRYFSFDNGMRLERLKNALECFRKNSGDKTEMLKNAERMLNERDWNAIEKTIAIALPHGLYIYYYFTNLINIKLLIYITIIYNNNELTKLQKVIEAYKIVKYPEIFNWKEEEHKFWNKENFSRFVATTSSLIKMCSDMEELLAIILMAPKYFEEKLEGVEWTLQTIFKRFAGIRIYNKNKLGIIEKFKAQQKRKVEEKKEKKEEKPLSQEEVNAKMSELRKKLGLKKKERK